MIMRLARSDPDANMSRVTPARSQASSLEPLRVAIVEDDVTMRDGLAALIDGTPGYRCVARHGSVEELLRKAPDRTADVVLLDINLPGMSGAKGVRLVRQRWPSTEVLMLTVFSEESTIFESICNGAVGYLLKKTPPARLLEAIREAATGGAPMSPEIARKVLTLFRKTPAPDRPSDELTAQELRLLQLLADGHSYQATAERLKISVNTVRSYVRNVYDKLQVHSKSEAVSKALRTGLIT
jgi:DNA-binding NarL/FixJ family response regulator